MLNKWVVKVNNLKENNLTHDLNFYILENVSNNLLMEIVDCQDICCINHK